MPYLSKEDAALRDLLFTLARTLTPGPLNTRSDLAVREAVDEINRQFGPGTLDLKRAYSWVRNLRRDRSGEHKRYAKPSEKSPAMRHGHYVRSANGSRARLIDEIERGEAEAPWANGRDRTEWGRMIDRTRFPMPRVEFQGRVL